VALLSMHSDPRSATSIEGEGAYIMGNV